MKKAFAILWFWGAALAGLALPFVVVANSHNTLANPLTSYPTIPAFIAGVLKAVALIGLPIIALFIVYAGFKYVLARGKEGPLQEAHKNLGYVIIGAFLILGAWVLATLIGGTVSQLVG